ncbi:hypothetical protein HJG60_010222 [Phyllostomus discolor]|uniref:Uncharacterized protein n=1 Tax=Phyllostomus discolor TaxID=89673 RepID=A0A834B1F9_9CHIR|nr:hypothetical protein HJG60_010222 [Phyllostomus discolor]
MEISQPRPLHPGTGECRSSPPASFPLVRTPQTGGCAGKPRLSRSAPLGSGARGVCMLSSAALAHPQRAPLSASPSPAASLFFLVTQWLNNFKHLELCPQLQLFKSSAGSKLYARSLFHTMGN